MAGYLQVESPRFSIDHEHGSSTANHSPGLIGTEPLASFVKMGCIVALNISYCLSAIIKAALVGKVMRKANGQGVFRI